MTKNYRSLAVLLFLLSPSAFGWYTAIGTGEVEIKQRRDDMWWYQESFSHEFDEKTNGYTITVGKQISRHFAVEIDYRNLGEFNSYAGYVQPDSNYNPITGGCNGPCNRTQWGWQHAEVKGFGLSVLGNYPLTKNLSATARAGLYVYRSETNVRVPDFNPDPYGRSYVTWEQTETGVAPFYGVGIAYKQFLVEAVKYSDAGSSLSPHGDAIGIMARFSIPMR